MAIKAEEISQIIRAQIEDFDAGPVVSEVGTVISVGDGIARIHGLEKVMYSELLEFPHGISGMALNLEEDQVGSVLLGEAAEIKEGDLVKRTGKIMAVPVGEAMVGRVVDPLGQPVDGKGPIPADRLNPVERIAPGIVDREPVKQPLQTGLKSIDSMIPIGRGAAGTDYRRPSDRKDGRSGGHDHQSEGRRRHLHLRGHRPEALHHRPGGSDPGGQRRHGLHHRGVGLGFRAGSPAVPGSLRRLRHR